MSVSEEAWNSPPTSAMAAGAENPDVELPRRASRVQLVGAMEGISGADRKWLICLDGAQYVQATELLYHLLLHADGQTRVDAIAERVAAETGRPVSSDELRWLIVNKLAGSGLLEWAPQGHAETGRRSARKRLPGRAFALALFLLSPFRLFVKGLILVARLLHRGVTKIRAGRASHLNRAPVQPQASPPAITAAPAQMPTPLDGLGRPVPQRDGAAIEQALRHVQESQDSVARELAGELNRAYGQRLDQMAAEIARVVAWTESVERERDRLGVQVRTLEGAVAELSTHMKRVAAELEAAAAAADRSLVTPLESAGEESAAGYTRPRGSSAF